MGYSIHSKRELRAYFRSLVLDYVSREERARTEAERIQHMACLELLQRIVIALGLDER